MKLTLLAGTLVLGLVAPMTSLVAAARDTASRDTASRNAGNHDRMRMLASWYGDEHRGRRAASGESFDPDGLTAAHRFLRLGTMLRIHNPANGRMVVVRVNDRGPGHRGRDLDLSAAAARRLGMLRRGVARLVVEIVGN